MDFLEGSDASIKAGSSMVVSYLLCVNDESIFCGAEPRKLGSLRCVLLFFEAVSELQINLSKSKMIPVGEVQNAAAILGCKLGALPI